MAFSAKAGSLNTGTAAAGNTVVVSSLGFQPEVVLFWWVGRTGGTDGVAAGYRAGFGAAASTTERYAVALNSRDGQASADMGGGTINDGCIALVNEGGSDVGTLDLQSMDADGFTLVVDTACTGSVRVFYLALGGTDLTNVKIGRIEWPAGTGNTSITGVGFLPDMVFGVMGGTSAVPSRSGTVGEMSISAATGSSAQYVLSFSSVDAVSTMVTNSYCLSGEFLSTVWNDGFDNRGSFVSMDSDGFTYNRIATNFSGAEGFYIALKGGSYKLGDLLTQTDTTTDIVESSFGFQPTGLAFFSHGISQSSAGTVQAPARASVGFGTSTTNRFGMGVMDTDNVGDSTSMNGVEADEVYINLDADAYIGWMDIKSIDSGGFTCIMDDADPSQAFVWYVAFGNTAAGTEYTQSASGGVTPTGAVSKLIMKQVGTT